jgi:hypothetical protein
MSSEIATAKVLPPSLSHAEAGLLPSAALHKYSSLYKNYKVCT